MYRLEAIDFGRRMAVDKEIEKIDTAPQPNAIFDESSNFLIYATLLGIKVKILLLTQIRNVIFFSCTAFYLLVVNMTIFV